MKDVTEGPPGQRCLHVLHILHEFHDSRSWHAQLIQATALAMITRMPTFDTRKAEAFAHRVLSHVNSGAFCLMASIGHRTSGSSAASKTRS
jgi:hypothetical protein